MLAPDGCPLGTVWIEPSQVQFCRPQGHSFAPTRHMTTPIGWIRVQSEKRSHLPRAALPVLGDDLDGPDDVPVKLLEVFGRNPVLEDRLTASLLDVVPIEVRLVDHEACDVSEPAGLNVPVAGNLRCVLLVQNGIEDRLIRQSGQPLTPARGFDQREFC